MRLGILGSLSLIIGTRVANSKKTVTWPWIRKDLIASESEPNRRSVPFLIQSEEKVKVGSVLSSLICEAASLTKSGVTLLTSLIWLRLIVSSTSVLMSSNYPESSTELNNVS